MTHAGTPLPLTVAITVVVAAITVIAWRYRNRPGGRPFVGIMALITFQTTMGIVDWFGVGGWPIMLATAGGFTMTAVWLVFVLEYTGFTRFVNRYTLAAVSIAPLLIVGITIVRFAGIPPREVVPRFLGFLFPLHFLGTIVLGNLLLLKFALTESRLYTDQSVALIVGMAAPFVGYLFNNVVDNPLPGDAVLLSLAVTGVAFAFALYRFELFEVLPVTHQIGRDAAVEDLEDGVLIVDPTRQVVDANDAAGAIFGRPRSALVGEPVRAVFGDQAPDDPDAVAPPEYGSDDGRVYGVAVSEITNRANRHAGWTVVFRDITYRELRETQLEVLNRVLRHNLRNKLSTVQGHAELLEGRVDGEASEFVERQLAATTDLMELGERAREFEQLEALDAATPRRVAADALVDGLVAPLREEVPDATVTVDVPPGLEIETYPNSLEIVLENLLWNAAEHTDQASPRIDVGVTVDDGTVAFAVRDDGPGIPAAELEVLNADTETALDHGSGMGLWIAKWGVQYLGGDLSFETGESEGTTATVTIPKAVSTTEAATGGVVTDG